MRRKRKKQILILAISLSLCLGLLLNEILRGEDTGRIYNISIITRGKNSESLMIMKEGIDQAALEMNANISFVTLSEDNSVDEQNDLIKREMNNGADAILISPVDYEKMSEAVDNAASKLPVVQIESKVNSNRILPIISCDNFQLGASLGEEVIKMGGSNNKIAIVKNNLECSSIKERYDGFMDAIKNTNNEYTLLDITGYKQGDYYRQVRDFLDNNNVDAIVTFDTSMLEAVGQAKKDMSTANNQYTNIQIYGTGSTSKIISFLEEKVVNATAMQNEFNVGYIGVKTAVSMINKKKIDDSVIYSTVVNSDNMYSNENQRLLFPFVR